MSLKYGFLSLSVFCIGIFLFFKDYEVWTQPVEIEPQKVAAEKNSTKNPDPASIKEPPKNPDSFRSSALIAEKNIFSPQRKDFPNPVQQANTRVRPQIVLYGVTIAGDVQLATVISPGRPLKKGEREAMSLKAGERIGDYKLASILPDRVVLECGEDKFEVLISDPKKPKQRDQIQPAPNPMAVSSYQPVAPPIVRERPVTIPSRETVQQAREPVRMTDVPLSMPKLPEVPPSAPMPVPKPSGTVMPAW